MKLPNLRVFHALSRHNMNLFCQPHRSMNPSALCLYPQHILNMHTVGREMHCEICQKKVKNKWYLRRHHVTHHGAPLKK